MTKRITALIIALIIPLALLTACGKTEEVSVPDILLNDPTVTVEGEPLSVEEYYNTLREKFHDYSKAVTELPYDENSTFNEIKANRAASTTACAHILEKLCEFQKINPPEKYAEKHKKLIGEPLAKEKEITRAEWKWLFSTTEKESVENGNKFKALVEAANSDAFPDYFSELIKELKAEAGDVSNPESDFSMV